MTVNPRNRAADYAPPHRGIHHSLNIDNFIASFLYMGKNVNPKAQNVNKERFAKEVWCRVPPGEPAPVRITRDSRNAYYSR